MDFCLELGIATDLAEEIRGSLNLTHPLPLHLTLLIFECDDPREAVSNLESERVQIPPLTVSHIGIFAGSERVVFLAPVVTRALLDYHAHLLLTMRHFAKSTEFLTGPDVWVPHVTLPCNTEPTSLGNVFDLAAKLSHRNLPVSGLFFRESMSRKVVRSWVVPS